jgi:uncharacterized protein (TIGR00299 family) protein
VRIAYLDAFSGISGDMTVGALVDLGLPLEALRAMIATLALDGVEVWTERVHRHGVAATKLQVRVHGRHPDAPHAHEHGPHDHAHHGHRAWAAIREQIGASPLDAAVRERALAIFARLADAEATAHGVPVEQVQFHEVGALDALVDVCGAALGFVHLGVDVVHCAPLPLGRGLVRAAHGPLPVPGPAVTALLRGRAVRFEDGAAELVTPTGAAIVAGLASPDPVPPLVLDAVGWGAGDRELADRPNVLRIALGTPAVSTAAREDVVVLEATIDDTNPQLYEHVLERLLAEGARDAFLAPALMKKSRPGTTLRVLARPEDRERLAAVVFAETSTIGLRWATWHRIVLPREERRVETPWGSVRVKVATAPDGTRNVAPEFEDCRALARRAGVPLKVVQQAALAAALR